MAVKLVYKTSDTQVAILTVHHSIIQCTNLRLSSPETADFLLRKLHRNSSKTSKLVGLVHQYVCYIISQHRLDWQLRQCGNLIMVTIVDI